MKNEDVMVTVSRDDAENYEWCEDNCEGSSEGETETQFLFKSVRGDILEELEYRFDDDIIIL